ncbi:MAG: putative metal-dependent hydrolase [Verrucomicrobiales bacterium]|nr:putative metal-dependent hydrolase [Verrucomicrobiales bacterium]
MPGELCLRNRQHTQSLNLPLLRKITTYLLANHFRPAHHEFCVHLVEADEMADVNQRFLQHAGSTDVITFDYAEPSGTPFKKAGHRDLSVPLPSLHGEVFISVSDAVTQARQFRTTWQLELTRYLIHGLLHLQGYDDLKPNLRQVMKREEQRLLKLTSREFELTQLQKPKTRRRLTGKRQTT